MEDAKVHMGEDVPNNSDDALSGLFTLSPEGTNFLSQCDISAYDRHSIIAERLANTSDDATRLGRELSARIVLGQNLDADFRNNLTERGGEDIVTIIRQIEQRGESIDKSAVTKALAAQIEGLTSARIFEDLPLDQRSEEEGRKRAQAETALVLAKAGLLELGYKAMATGDFQDAAFAINKSGVITSHYPQWFSQGCATALRQYDIPHMTDADLPTLEQLKDLYWAANTNQDGETAARLTTNPEELTPLQYMHRKFWEASRRIDQLKKEEQSLQARAEHDRQLTVAREQNFQITADRSYKATENVFSRGRNGIFIDEEYLGRLIHLDPHIEQAYINGQSGWSDNPYGKVRGILGMLRSLSDGDFLTRASIDFADAGSPNYMYNDGTSHNLGDLSQMSPDDATSAVRAQIEQRIYATAFGILQAVAEQSLGTVHNQTMPDLVKGVLQIVGQGRAVDLLANSDRGSLGRSFSITQVQFRVELEKYMADLNRTHLDKARALGNATIKAAPAADIETKQQAETKAREAAEANQQFVSLESSLVDVRASGVHFRENTDRMDALRNPELLYASPESLHTLLSVRGSDETREITVNQGSRLMLQQELDQLKLDSQNQSLSAQERQAVERKIPRVDARLRLFAALEEHIQKLGEHRFVKSQGIFFKSKAVSYDTAALVDALSMPDFNSIQLKPEDVQLRLESIVTQLEALRAGDRVSNGLEMQQLQQQIQRIGSELTGVTGVCEQSDKLIKQLLGYIVNRIFSKVGPLQTLVNQRGSQFHGIFQQR